MTSSPGVRRMALVGAAVVLIAASARLTLPMPGVPVPQSAQTLAVLLAGALLGPMDGVAALITYLLAGALGLPVFADGASGWQHLTGPSAGYLVGFALAAGAVGWTTQHGMMRVVWKGFLVMLGGHLIILTIGWLRLSLVMGGEAAFSAGVRPFIVGGVVKSGLAACLVWLFVWHRGGFGGRGSDPVG